MTRVSAIGIMSDKLATHYDDAWYSEYDGWLTVIYVLYTISLIMSSVISSYKLYHQVKQK